MTHGVVLHRSRRQHYSPVVVNGSGHITLFRLPAATAKLWPCLSCVRAEEPEEQDDALDQQKITQKSRKRLKTEGEFFVTKV